MTLAIARQASPPFAMLPAVEYMAIIPLRKERAFQKRNSDATSTLLPLASRAIGDREIRNRQPPPCRQFRALSRKIRRSGSVFFSQETLADTAMTPSAARIIFNRVSENRVVARSEYGTDICALSHAYGLVSRRT